MLASAMVRYDKLIIWLRARKIRCLIRFKIGVENVLLEVEYVKMLSHNVYYMILRCLFLREIIN